MCTLPHRMPLNNGRIWKYFYVNLSLNQIHSAAQKPAPSVWHLCTRFCYLSFGFVYNCTSQMCIEIFLAFYAETEWVGYLSDLICRSCRHARRTRGSNYIKDERSVGIHYSMRLHPWAKNRNQVLWFCRTAAREAVVSTASFLSPLTKP